GSDPRPPRAGMTEAPKPFLGWLRQLNRAQRAQLDAASEALAAQEKMVEAKREELGISDQPSPTMDALDASKAAVEASKTLLDAQEEHLDSVEELMRLQWAWLNWWKF
ncbi:MAG: hypothetical protein KGN34_16570, partial [Sphingomonadales bacterium]|nr:hypothetical protein [Sphingomonadales bacterium]